MHGLLDPPVEEGGETNLQDGAADDQLKPCREASCAQFVWHEALQGSHGHFFQLRRLPVGAKMLDQHVKQYQ